MGRNEDEEKLILPVSKTYYVSIALAIVIMIAGYFTQTIELYAASAMIVFMGFVFDQARNSTEIERFAEGDKLLKLGAVQIAAIRLKFYSVGFVNNTFYLRFLELNRGVVISTETHAELVQKQIMRRE